MLIANGFFFIKHIWSFCNTFAVAATFSILNVDVNFLHPNVGFPLAKSKNLTFSCRYKVFYASLPASCCFVSDIFAVPTLSIRFFKCFERLHLQFEVSTFGVWFHVQFYDIQNSRNRIFAFTISHKHVDQLSPWTIVENHWRRNRSDYRKRKALFIWFLYLRIIMHIWRYGR